MQENKKVAWGKRLYASASAVVLGCLLPMTGHAGALDVVSKKPIDPALANIPRISAPARWSAYKPELKTETKLVALAVPVPAMAPAPLHVAAINTPVVPKRKMSPLDVAWSSQSPKPSLSQPAPVKEKTAQVAAYKPEHTAAKPVQVAQKEEPQQYVEAPKTIPRRIVRVSSLSSLPPSVPPVETAGAQPDARLMQKLAAAPITPAVAPTPFRRNGKSPLEVIASLQRKEIMVGTLLQDEPANKQVDEVAASRKDTPVTPPIKLTDATVPAQREAEMTSASVSLDDLWKEFDNSQADVASLAPDLASLTPAAGGNQPQAKQEAKQEPKVKAEPAEIKPVIQASLTQAAQTTVLPKTALVEKQASVKETHASPLEITSANSAPADSVSQPVVAVMAEPAALEPAAGSEPLSLMPPSAPKVDVKQDLPAAKPLPPVVEKKAMTVEDTLTGETHTDITEPVPAPGKKGKMPAAAKAGLSAESQAVLDSLPPEVRTGNTVTKNVKLERSNKPGSEEDAVKKHEAYGMKISVKRPKVDVFRMLESAYNSLIAGDQQYAIVLYKEVLDEEPDNTLALFGLATTYHRAGQTTLARPLYAKLLEIDPHNVEGLNNFLVLLADESPDAALEELEKLRQTHPSFSPVLAQMALIHEKRGEYDLAVQKLGQAYNISPENLKYQYNMAIVLDKMKDWPEASKWYQRLLTASERGEKIPGNPQEIQQRLTFIRSNTSTVN